jgi:hypothetical protein
MAVLRFTFNDLKYQAWHIQYYFIICNNTVAVFILGFDSEYKPLYTWPSHWEQLCIKYSGTLSTVEVVFPKNTMASKIAVGKTKALWEIGGKGNHSCC